MGYVNQELSAQYHHGFEEIANHRNMAANDNQIAPDMNIQGKSAACGMGSQRGMHAGSSTATQGMIAGPGMASHMDFGQMPLPFSTQVSQPMLQTRPGQMLQHIMGQIPQNVPGQIPQSAQAQFARALLEQMTQAMPGEPPQVNPRQMFKQASGPMVQPGNGQMMMSMPGGHLQVHPQRGGGRGGDNSFQSMRGSMRGRGKHGGSISGPGGW